MSLFQNLLITYQKCAPAIGIASVNAEGSVNEKKTLLPVFHITFKSKIHIIINIQGRFISANRDSKEETIIIPCTEDSAGRSSGTAPHPLCDQLDYVSGINDEKTSAYLSGLESWMGQIAELKAIYTYVANKTMMNDLCTKNIFTDGEFKNKDNQKLPQDLDIEKIRKIGVRFTVQTDKETVDVWKSVHLRNAWVDYITRTTNHKGSLFDYLSGENITVLASQHPKNINSFSGNAKFLSCNDISGFTFRGRFAKQDDAIMLDSVQSQKMHQMLRWLIANCGYAVDTQVIVTWAVDDKPQVKVKPQQNSFDVFGEIEAIKTDADVLSDANAQVYIDYANKLNLLLQGYGDAKQITQHSRKICIAAFDSATTGRMGLVFYQELSENTYLENIVNWHNDTAYFQTAWKSSKDEKGKEKRTPIHYIGSPSYDEILFAVYGASHGDASYNVLKKKTRKQLLECMFGNFPFPKNMLIMAANRASRPMTFTDKDNKFKESDWKRSINITCALARKYYKQQGSELELELNTERRDRDYLFGRLLAVAERLESTALYNAQKKNNGNKKDKRATNAIKLMSAFQIKPYSTWGQLFTQLIPYKNQLKGAGYYQSIIDEIMVLFRDGDFEDNAPLSPLYLLGYSAQNRVLIQKNKNEKLEELEDVDTEEQD